MENEYNFEKLQVYQEGMNLVEEIYRITRNFPKEEQYGMIAQIRRAALSVPLNIAEGKGRFHTKIFIQFLYQARGSLYEVMALIKLSLRLAYLKEQETKELLTRCRAISIKISNLINSMK